MFITRKEIPHDCRKYVTYAQFVCSVRPKKKDKNRTRFTLGGDKIYYPGEVATPTADILATQILFNSIISTKESRLMTINTSNVYFMPLLKRPE